MPVDSSNNRNQGRAEQTAIEAILKMQYGRELIEIIARDSWMMEKMEIVRSLGLTDCWIGAGFVRNKIWDVIHGKDRSPLNDLDVVYFDKTRDSENDDLIIENKLKEMDPGVNWSVKNQARMHVKNNHLPYEDCSDALSWWPETATSVAIRLSDHGQIEYLAPYGLDDLFQLIIRPTQKADLVIFTNRAEQKHWKKRWERLKIFSSETEKD